MNLQAIDTAAFTMINTGLANPLFDAIMPFITAKGYLLLIPYLLLLYWKVMPQGSSSALRKVSAIIFWSVLVVLLADWSGLEIKNAVARVRPCLALENVHQLVGCSASGSFPSNHATNAFAVAMVMVLFTNHLASGVLRWYPILVAALISFSRPYVGVHYPSDIFAGAILGSLVGYLFWKAVQAARAWYRTNPHATILAVTLGGLTLIRVYYILHGPLNLSPDEAHYWEWSRRLDWSYYSKGPMIAWLTAAGTALFGNTVFGVRFFAPVLSALGSLVLYRFVISMYSASGTDQARVKDIALASSVLLQIVPLFAPFGVVFTIDSPFVFFWILGLAVFWQALVKRPEDKPVTEWLVVGAVIGLGLLTKYTMAFFIGSAFLLLLFSGKRFWLRTPYPYAALAMSLIIFSPVIYWNFQNDWVTVRHTAGQAHIAAGFMLSLRSFADFSGSQIGIVTPILFGLMCTAFWQARAFRSDPAGRYLFWFTVPIVLFFFLKSIQGKVQPNWAMTGYVTGLVAITARYWSWSPDDAPAGRKWRMGFLAGAVLAFAVTVAAYVAPFTHQVPVDVDPAARMQGWRELGKEVGRVADSMGGADKLLIMSDSYQEASELAFYIPGQPKAFCIVNGRRMNQYDLWPDINTYADELRRKGVKPLNGIFIQYSAGELPPAVLDAFERFEKKLVQVYDRGRLLRVHTVTRCYGFKGLRQQTPLTY